MPSGLRPVPTTSSDALPGEPAAVVEAFLAALADRDVETAKRLVDDDILYVNVGLPSVRGREQMSKVFDLLARPAVGFEVYVHAISADGPVVLTERTDVLIAGRVRSQFWVWGRFEVIDGKITLWRDSFDYLDIMRGTARGVLAALLPSLQPRKPESTDDPPGR